MTASSAQENKNAKLGRKKIRTTLKNLGSGDDYTFASGEVREAQWSA